MTGYISRAAAAAEIARAYQDGRTNTLEEILGVLDMLPAAEVEAVRSTWVPHGNIVYDLYQCNRCGHIIQEEDEILPEECPACHAGMEPHRRKRPPVTLPCEDCPAMTMTYTTKPSRGGLSCSTRPNARAAGREWKRCGSTTSRRR